MNRLLFLVLFAMTSLMSLAQADRQYIRYGNRHFHQQNFVKAEAEYRERLSVLLRILKPSTTLAVRL